MTANTAIPAINPDTGTLELVRQAQVAYAAGCDREWAGALWLAGERAVRELAKSRGIPPTDSIVALLDQLDRQDKTVRDGYYSRQLWGLLMLRTHYRMGVLESYWWEDLHHDIIAYINECHAAAA